MEYADPATFPAIGQRLRLLRMALMPRSSRAQFARLVGLSRTTWVKCEIGTARLSLTTALVLHQKFGVSLDWVYLGDGRTMPQELMMRIAALEQGDQEPEK
jgi:DNA-binding XRE family transcriptional regulator